MRFFIKILSLLVLACFIVSCATTKNPLDAFKHKSAQEIFAQGEHALVKKNYADAATAFEALDALYPFSPQVEQAQLDVIYAYYQNDAYASALAAADRYIHLYPRSKNAPYAYYMRGVTNMESSQSWLQKLYHSNPAELDLKGLRTAFSNFNELVQQFPNSIYTPDAYQRMIFIRDQLAEHEIDVAKFYFARKAYVAAANRANYVVQHLQETPQVKEALRIMVKSYHALGATKEANAAWRVLQLNYAKTAAKNKQSAKVTKEKKVVRAKKPAANIHGVQSIK